MWLLIKHTPLADPTNPVPFSAMTKERDAIAAVGVMEYNTGPTRTRNTQ